MNKTKTKEKKPANGYDLFDPINEVCKDCIHSCKQLTNVVVVFCPQRETHDSKKQNN